MPDEWFDIICPNCGITLPGKESYLKSFKTCSKCKKSVQYIKASTSETCNFNDFLLRKSKKYFRSLIGDTKEIPTRIKVLVVTFLVFIFSSLVILNSGRSLRESDNVNKNKEISNVKAIKPSDNLGAWRKANYLEKNNLCGVIIRAIDDYSFSSNDLYMCISETAGDGELDHLKISEVATACVFMLRK